MPLGNCPFSDKDLSPLANRPCNDMGSICLGSLPHSLLDQLQFQIMTINDLPKLSLIDWQE